jgi:predicted component of type VI protein secretion system
MTVLRNLESKIAGLVEGTFGRVFPSEVRPVELAHKLAREMDEHRTVSLSRTYVPNEYVVWLSPDDRAKYEGVEQPVIDELSAYLLEHARRERLTMVARPVIELRTDERLSLGEFGIQARLVRAPADEAGEAAQGDHGHTMVYRTETGGRPAAQAATRALVVTEGRRLPVSPSGSVIGRSRDCDIVLADPNVSRRHAEITSQDGAWAIRDLGSTNGVRVNDGAITAPHPLSSGDRIKLGTAELVFELH